VIETSSNTHAIEVSERHVFWISSLRAEISSLAISMLTVCSYANVSCAVGGAAGANAATDVGSARASSWSAA
jgi:hypothetical protein